MNDDLRIQLWLDTHQSQDEILHCMRRNVKNFEVQPGNYGLSRGNKIDVRTNSVSDSELQGDPECGFLNYPVYIDILPLVDSVDHSSQKTLLLEIVEAVQGICEQIEVDSPCEQLIDEFESWNSQNHL